MTTIVVLFGDLWRALRDGSPALSLCGELARAGARVTVRVDAEPIGFGADWARRAVARFLGEATELTFQVGGDVPCADIMLATDSTTAYRAWESKSRATWAAYLVSEYEPAHCAPGRARDRAIGSYELGMDLFVLDPGISDLVAQHRAPKINVLPTRIEGEPPGFDPQPDSTTVFVVSSRTGLPDLVWAETVKGLERVRADHPEIRIVLGGEAAARGEAAVMGLPVIPQIGEQAYDLLLARRPICVLLCPSGRPPRVTGMTASGCPVIVVKTRGEPIRKDVEMSQGVIEVQAESWDIARAIDSLLIDRVRLGSLTMHAGEYLRGLPDPAEVAQTLIEQFRLHGETDRNPGQGDGLTSIEATHRLAVSSGIAGELDSRARSGLTSAPRVGERRVG